VDALAQVVHVVEVLAPALVDDLQQQVALERAHQLLAELVLALVVELQRVLDEQPLELSRSIDSRSSSSGPKSTLKTWSSWTHRPSRSHSSM
jgi:hypothetical protein